ncbi:MAG: S-layer homology domain-containing protein [Anaerotignum sp.]|nr:S-layer homology domain-containing protein [Anaerotignum sp.]
MKRKLTLFLSAVMAVSSLPMTAYAANFKDINEVAWAVSAINGAADKGLISGYEDNTVRAKNNVTYPEAMQMLYNALVKSGKVRAIDAVTAYKYVPTLTTYKVPSWSQMAVAYGLENGIIDMQDMVSKFALGNKYATREDVAEMFGKALAYYYDVDGKAASAMEFIDYYKISGEKAPLIDLLKRMEILNGDTSRRFNPQNNINRAEMAVMLNKTFDILSEGVLSTGKIVDFQNNNGDFFYIEVEFENGRKQGFHATPDGVKAFGADGKQMALSRLGKGDEVRIGHNGDMLYEVHVTDGISAQEKYDITGYITNMKENAVTVENENTGETDKYNIDRDCYCYVDGVKVKRTELEEALKEKYNLHAYAGIIVEVEKEKNDSGKWEYVTTVVEIHVTFSEDYTVTGKVDDLSGTRVKFKPAGSSNTKEISYADGCEFYWEGAKADLEDLIEEAEAGTTYVKVNTNSKDKATEVYLSTDAFEAEGSSDKMEGKIVVLEDLSDKEIEVSVGSKDYSYRFDSKNPIENIRFYMWDSTDEDGDWDDGDEDNALDFVEKYGDKKIYCQLDFNSGGKISAIELSRTKKAWSEDDDQNERKGTVESLKDGVLKFKGSNTEYKMLSQYNVKEKEDDDRITGKVNGKTVANPLLIESAITSSLKVFEKMANDDDLELYAEIIADSDGKIQSINARLTKAEGKMVEFVREDHEDAPFIKIETGDSEYKLHIKKSPELTDEDEDYFNLEDIEDTKYAGEKIELGFNSSGVADTITVVDGPKNGSASVKVEGIATAANDGLKIKGKSGTYKWLSKTSDIIIKNYSGPSESLATIKKMIEDDALEVYVEARLDDKDRVESIKVYVKSAVGKIDKDGYDEYLRIETENGNTFSFDVKSNVVIDVDGYDEDALERGKADGTEVNLKFSDDGQVSKIAKAE